MSLAVYKNRWRPTWLFGVMTLVFVLVASPIVGTLARPANAAIGQNPLDGVTQVSNRCAVASSKAYCWGYNYSGQLGNGTNINSGSPVAVDTSGVLAGKTVTQVMSNGVSACAVASSKAYCWGYNDNGILGNGTNVDSNVPVAVDTSGVLAGKTVTQVQLTYDAACALADGKVYCWGANGNSGLLGNGTNTDSNVPVAVDTSGVLAGKTVTQIAINGDTSAGGPRACALADGKVYCWGTNGNSGLLGNGTNTDSNVPVAVDTSSVLAGKTVTQIDLGTFTTCALADGKVYCWGFGYYGYLGNGTNVDSNVPVAVDTSGVLAGKTVTQIRVTYSTTCAITDGKAYCWGGNGSGQLGNGTNTDSNVPVAVDTSGVLAGKTVTQIDLGEYTTCAVADGKAYCWGTNGSGQLGNGTNTDSNVPVAVDTSGVLAGKTVTQTTLRGGIVCALADSKSYCWGPAMLGNGAEEGSNVPVLVGFEYSIPEISSLSRDKVGTNISGTQTTIRGLDFAGSVTVEIGGRQATVVYSNSTAIGIEIPVSPTPGAVDVKVTNGNGQFVILHNGFTYETPSPRVVNGVAFGEEAGKKIMTITGTGLVGAEDPTEFQQAMIPPFKSFVSLNGVALDFCTHGTGFTQADLEGYNVPGSTDDPTCYYLFNSSVQPVITPTAAKIWLVDSFDITAPGSVIVNGSAPFLFNQPGGGESDDDATVVVNGQSLANTPEIAKRSTFSGTAEPGAQVTVTVHSDPVSCTGIADAQGRWSCTLPTDLVPGQHTVYVHVVNPDSTTIDLGPYSVTVAGDSPTTLSAPNTGMQRIRIFSSPQVLLVFGGAILSLGVLIYALYRRVNDLKS